MNPASGYHAWNVERGARSVFGDEALPRAMKILGRSAGDEEELKARVQLAALKLSAGELEKLHEAVDQSLVDWRDVLAWAEYPETLAAGPGLADSERRRVSRSDLAQYVAWLESVGLDDVRPVGG